ncbi:phospholipase/carboxylesterase [Glaciihabitans tibetensis]|uniref:Phospholipase/carboxylesterase n=1 Tax=Glaciihabitans tibetensis TaxID=1266600 RepID=A0A2T0VBG2_9MICO|nr:dienelactone hydrolase family protein [Glaciihabitans tibetensis]PRY67501.1 phospholipase/carboxylesterase [Glaciihabitans tibetensis]
MRIDPEAVLWSAPERERAGRPLLVLLHGYGSHEGDLFGLSPRLPLGPVIASLRAPIPENGGNAWFTMRDSTPGDPSKESVDAAASAVLEWLDTVDYTSVGLLGFSQGAALSLQLIRHAPERFAATVALSGFIASGGHPGDAELARVRPEVFYGRGTADQIISHAAVERTEAWIPAHTSATSRIYEDLAHSISAQELADIAEFLRGKLD